MVLYFDMCCLKRPFDDQTQARIALERTAVLALLKAVDQRQLRAVRSLAHELENSRNPNPRRARAVAAWLATLNPMEATPEGVINRAITLQQRGLGTLDALHIAWAEYLKVDVFVTVDDDLLARTARMPDIMIGIRDPVALVMELSL